MFAAAFSLMGTPIRDARSDRSEVAFPFWPAVESEKIAVKESSVDEEATTETSACVFANKRDVPRTRYVTRRATVENRDTVLSTLY